LTTVTALTTVRDLAAPRAVRYQIDQAAGTAMFVQQVTDGIAPSSGCCGSARVLPTGNYVVGWGGTPWFTENQPNGSQAFRLAANFIYRAIPIMPGFYTRQQLRDGWTPSSTGRMP